MEEKLIESKAIVSKLPHGPIPLGMRDQILEFVETCWDKFKGSGHTKMKVWKICRDPNLCFSIERHGGTVMGSKRAE